MTDKFIEQIKKTGAPVCVGLDPKLSYLPECISKKIFSENGLSLE